MNETFKDKIKIQIIGNRENGFKEQDKTYNAIMVMELDEEPWKYLLWTQDAKEMQESG